MVFILCRKAFSRKCSPQWLNEKRIEIMKKLNIYHFESRKREFLEEMAKLDEEDTKLYKFLEKGCACVNTDCTRFKCHFWEENFNGKKRYIGETMDEPSTDGSPMGEETMKDPETDPLKQEIVDEESDSKLNSSLDIKEEIYRENPSQSEENLNLKFQENTLPIQIQFQPLSEAEEMSMNLPSEILRTPSKCESEQVSDEEVVDMDASQIEDVEFIEANEDEFKDSVDPFPLLEYPERQVATFTGLDKAVIKTWVQELKSYMNPSFVHVDKLSIESAVCLIWTKMKMNFDFETVAGIFNITEDVAENVFFSYIAIMDEIAKSRIVWQDSADVEAEEIDPALAMFETASSTPMIYNVYMEGAFSNQVDVGHSTLYNSVPSVKFVLGFSPTKDAKVSFVSCVAASGGSSDSALLIDSNFLKMVRPGFTVVCDIPCTLKENAELYDLANTLGLKFMCSRDLKIRPNVQTALQKKENLVKKFLNNFKCFQYLPKEFNNCVNELVSIAAFTFNISRENSFIQSTWWETPNN